MSRFFKMNFGIIFLKQILILLFIFACFKNDIYSQGTNIRRGKPQGAFFGISLEPSKSQIIYDETMVYSITTGTGISFGGSFEAGYFFSNIFGLSSGIIFRSYEAHLALNSYYTEYNAEDSEVETYRRRVEGSDITELQEIGFLEIPFCINLRLPFNGRSGLFLQAGASMAVPVRKDYQSKGTFSYSGFYAIDNVVLEDLPEYDFPSDLQTSANGELQLKQFGFNALASAGFDFFIQKKIQVAIGGFYDGSISDYYDYPLTGNFKLSTDAGQINSLMGWGFGMRTQSLGLKICLRYFLK